MDVVISAVVSDLITRFISFIVEKYQVQGATGKIPRLQQLLLRARIITEEAEGRQITNHGMLEQLQQLREATYRGYYVLDTSEARASRPKKGVAANQCRLQSNTADLEAMLDGMKEFLRVLMHCPTIVRQPYNAYLFMEKCMFGRHAEKERIINFLLRPCSSLDVLPVIGPCFVGKWTLVENAYGEEIVQRNFSHILRFTSDDLNNLANDGGMDDNRRKLGLSDGKSLIVMEVIHEKDVVLWSKHYRSLCHGADGTKVVLISRMDQVSGLGTVQPLRLTRLRQEEYWYFFRVLAFGSANPYDHHPDLASIAKEIAIDIDGSLMFASIITGMLRANLNPQFWRRALVAIRKSMHINILVFGENPRHISSKKYSSYFYNFSHDGPLMVCFNRYRTRSMMQRDIASMIRPEDVLTARATKYGEKFDIIIQSPNLPITIS